MEAAAHQNQVGNSQTHHHHPLDAKEEHPSGHRPMAAAAATAVDRTKRDEWSEGAVMSLLDAYEAKWVLRNRAKLKGQDWEDVARAVSARAGEGKSAKTATQCKNKVESMKKRYRSESSTGNGSRWPLYARLDGLVRCREPVTVVTVVERPDHEEQQMAPRPVAIAHGTAMAVPELPKPNGEVAIAMVSSIIYFFEVYIMYQLKLIGVPIQDIRYAMHNFARFLILSKMQAI